MKRSSEKLYGKCPRSEQPLVPPFSFCNGRNLQSVEDFKKEIIGSRNSVEYLKGSKEGISSPLPLQLSIYIDALLIFRDIFEQK